jgi:valyl-tRNA synthetase
MSAAIVEARALTDAFDFSSLADRVYHLIFDDFADWYLELLKTGDATPEVAGPLLEQLLTLAPPLMPFVTEECWSLMPGSEGMLLTHAPPAEPGVVDPDAERAVEGFQELVGAVRSYKSEHGMARRDPLRIDLRAESRPWISQPGLEALTGAALGEVPGDAHVIPASFGSVLAAPPQIDPDAERARLQAALEAARSELARAEKQLQNEGFTSRAPAELVEAERRKAVRYGSEVETLTAQLGALEGK